MHLCVDVHYRTETVVAACVGFVDWRDETPAVERKKVFQGRAAAYEPGQFYRREMPYILDLLHELDVAAGVLIVDGYVWLDGGRAGLGGYLYEALGRARAVVGVAKRPFRGAEHAKPVLRGVSGKPLFVSAAGMGVDEAVQCIARMHGPHRVPTLLRRADRGSRE